MKIRSGFVSNSSSSSFVCELCRHADSGMDVTYEEMGFVSCVNNHTICISHIDPINEKIMTDLRNDRHSLPFELVKLLIREHANTYSSIKPEKLDELFNTKNEEEIREAVDDDLDCIADDIYAEMPSSFCPVCNLQAIPTDTIATYLMFIDNVTPEDVQKHIYKEFGDWDTFKARLIDMKKKVHNK